MFIGENLNEKQVAALQAVADSSFGSFATVDSIKEIAEIFSVEELDHLLHELQDEYLVELKVIKGKPHAKLTEDGARCNRIRVLGY